MSVEGDDGARNMGYGKNLTLIAALPHSTPFRSQVLILFPLTRYRKGLR